MGDLPDPVAHAIEGLVDQVTRLHARIEELETQGTQDNNKRTSAKFGSTGDGDSNPEVEG